MRWPKPIRKNVDANAFSSKVIAVYCRHEQGGLLRNVRIERLGGRVFLVGEFAPRESREWCGVPCWLVVDEVIKILVFETIEEARRLFVAGKEGGGGGT